MKIEFDGSVQSCSTIHVILKMMSEPERKRSTKMMGLRLECDRTIFRFNDSLYFTKAYFVSIIHWNGSVFLSHSEDTLSSLNAINSMNDMYMNAETSVLIILSLDYGNFSNNIHYGSPLIVSKQSIIRCYVDNLIRFIFWWPSISLLQKNKS